METVLSRFHKAKSDHSKDSTSPFVCVSWAQSLDGFIAAAPGVQTIISCNEAMTLTHELRAAHDSILVGIGTVVADNPRLNSRLSRSKKSPQPVILDSKLRTPCNAKFLHIERKKRPIIFARKEDEYDDAMEKRCRELSGLADIRLVQSHVRCNGVDIEAALKELSDSNVESVMIEGGSKVITNVIDGGHADFLIITISPVIFGEGVPAFQFDKNRMSTGHSILNLVDPQWERLGTDIVLSGMPRGR